MSANAFMFTFVMPIVVLVAYLVPAVAVVAIIYLVVKVRQIERRLDDLMR